MNATLRVAAALFGLPLLLLAGCGMVAAPQPPSLKLPEPVTDLTAKRIGNQVELHWTMPRRATDKVLLVGDQRARICRHVDSGPCMVARNALFAPESSAAFTDQLPADLVVGSPRPMVYTVELENRAGRTAGPSNTAISSTGPAPPQITALQARAQAEGILLSWTPADGDVTVRIHRALVQKAVQKAGAQKPSALPLEQTLEFSGIDTGRVLDSDAALDQTYTYNAQRIEKLTLQGHPVEVAGEPGKTITIDARDVFPPATPAGLQTVADAEAHVIDLSWQPDTEPDLAGYMVYRREAGSGAPPVRISSPAQLAPSFRDTSTLPGHAYEYSVSAVDRDGNESPRSAEVEETLPQQ